MGNRRRVAKPILWWAAWLAADVTAAALRGVADHLHDWRTRRRPRSGASRSRRRSRKKES